MSHDAYTRNAADEGLVKEASIKTRNKRETALNDMRKVLATREGRRLIWRYIAECGVFRSSFTGNSHTFFNEGMRVIGLKLVEEVTDASPEAYLQMMKEGES